MWFGDERTRIDRRHTCAAFIKEQRALSFRSFDCTTRIYIHSVEPSLARTAADVYNRLIVLKFFNRISAVLILEHRRASYRILGHIGLSWMYVSRIKVSATAPERLETPDAIGRRVHQDGSKMVQHDQRTNMRIYHAEKRDDLTSHLP